MEPPHSDSAHGHPFRHSLFPQLLPTTDASSLQAQRSFSFVDRHGHVDMPSRQYRPPSRPPGQVVAQNERTLRHQKRRPDQKQPLRLHPDDHCPHGKRHQFERFMDRDRVEMALAQGELYQGLLRINAKKPLDAYVTCDALDSVVFVCNAPTRHHALVGDLVAIQHPA